MRHSILNTANTGLLITYIYYTSTAQPTAKCGTHRLLVHNDCCTNKQKALNHVNSIDFFYLQPQITTQYLRSPY